MLKIICGIKKLMSRAEFECVFLSRDYKKLCTAMSTAQHGVIGNLFIDTNRHKTKLYTITLFYKIDRVTISRPSKINRATLEYLAKQYNITLIIKRKSDIPITYCLPYNRLRCIYSAKKAKYLANFVPTCEKFELIIASEYRTDYRIIRDAIEELNEITNMISLDLISDPGLIFTKFTKLQRLTIINTINHPQELMELVLQTYNLKSLYISVHKYTAEFDRIFDQNTSLTEINIRLNNIYDIPTQSRLMQFVTRNALII